MAYVITDFCDMCGICADKCLFDAINEGDIHYEIDTERCVECGTCMRNCPLNAIKEA